MQKDSVYIFNLDGERIGEKPRGEIDKVSDILETVYVKVFIEDKILLSKVEQKDGGLKKLYEGKWGAPIATIVRVDELPEDAFRRASLDDIGEVPQVVQVHPRAFCEFENGSKRYVYEFEASLEKIPVHSARQFCLLTQDELKEAIDAGTVAETYMKLL
ncbi:MAG: hypothetical protein FGM57_00165 [Candidatus Taylorbacteria bacterium]|nr:hypothetical protein [Candidatus Taylorbacteria bacterium]